MESIRAEMAGTGEKEDNEKKEGKNSDEEEEEERTLVAALAPFEGADELGLGLDGEAGRGVVGAHVGGLIDVDELDESAIA